VNTPNLGPILVKQSLQIPYEKSDIAEHEQFAQFGMKCSD
jgi:hypothetical protein